MKGVKSEVTLDRIKDDLLKDASHGRRAKVKPCHITRKHMRRCEEVTVSMPYILACDKCGMLCSSEVCPDGSVCLCGGRFYKRKSPSNVPQGQANDSERSAYVQLADVLDEWIGDLETEDIYLLPKLLNKMKKFRVKHFS